MPPFERQNLQIGHSSTPSTSPILAPHTSSARAPLLVTGRLEQSSWEPKTGSRHTKHELIATEVGASLGYAGASITRSTRAAAENGDSY